MEDAEILEILVEQNFWRKEQDTGIERHKLLKELERLFKIGEITVVKGVRRSGKSTLLLQFFQSRINAGVSKKDTLIVNFEDPRFKELNLDLLNKIYELYLIELSPSKKHYVLLDEIQEINGWEKFARYLHETKKAHVFVTGSSSKLLSSEYATTLSGRHVDLQVYPLSFKEFLEFKNLFIKNKLDLTEKKHRIKRLLSEYMKWGGFPKICLIESERDKRTLLQSYYSDIVIKDIIKRYKVKDTGTLEEIAKYYLTNISNLHSFNKIKKTIKKNLETIERFSQYMENVYLLYFVKKFSYSKKEQIVNPRKVYCIDNGLRNVVAFTFMDDITKLTENLVFLELKQRNQDIYYWKDKNEVDFVTKYPDHTLEAINVTYTNEIKEREIKGLKELKQKFPKTKKLTIITKDLEKSEQGIQYTPLWKWLLEKKN